MSRRTRLVVAFGLLPLAVSALSSEATAQCPSWSRGFGGAGMDERVFALESFDLGSGPAVYAGGTFLTAGSVYAPYVAKWDGTRWTPVGDWLGGSVSALGEYDDGSGTTLYVGGSFPGNIRKLSGAGYVTLGPGLNSLVTAMAVFDDGGGPALYVAGHFTHAGALEVNGIAKWNGASWSALGSGLSSGPFSSHGASLAVFDDGTGPALFVGGVFTTAGGITANNIAKWNGTSWSALGSGVSGSFDPSVYALAGFAPAGGGAPKLYAAGTFTSAGGNAADRVASWDGAAWASVGNGFDGYVTSLEAFDDGSGAALYAGGGFTHSGVTPCASIARFDGNAWSPVGGGVDFGYVTALAAWNGPSPSLCIGGDFRSVGGTHSPYVAQWKGSMWAPFARSDALDGGVAAFAAFDDGAGAALYAGGIFHSAGGTVLDSIARWSGHEWGPVGGGTNGSVAALCVYDDGGGADLYAAGQFHNAGGTQVFSIARWDGQSWSALGSGVGTSVNALAVFDDGSGPALFAGGSLSHAGGVSVNNIARWDGTAWSALGSGVNSFVDALAVFDDGTGPALYAGGWFTSAGGAPASYIARWDGSSWSQLGSGLDDRVHTLAVYDDGTGPGLHAGGRFESAGGATARHVARWRAGAWSPLGSGLTGFGTQECRALAVYDDGSGGGPALYVGGQFSWAGGVTSPSLARWDGQSWAAVGGGVIPQFNDPNPAVSELAVFDDGSGGGPDLWVGGSFVATPPLASHRIARWFGCDGVGLLTCFGDGSGTACPCGNSSAPEAREGCANSLGHGASLRGSGRVSLAHDTLLLSSAGTLPTTQIYFQGPTPGTGGGTPLGDGLLCTGPAIQRLAVRANTNGTSSYPVAGEPSVSAAGGVALPGTRTYQVLYRDSVAFCGTDTFNSTNGLRIVWTP